MGQQDVVTWLIQNPGWHPTAEVVEALNQGYKGVQVALSRAAMWRDIEHRRDASRKGKEWRARI
jgi:hypothetical protein